MVVAVVAARVGYVVVLVVQPLPADGVVDPDLGVHPQVAHVALQIEGPLAHHRVVGGREEAGDVVVLQVAVVEQAQVHEVFVALVEVDCLPAQGGGALGDLVYVVEILDVVVVEVDVLKSGYCSTHLGGAAIGAGQSDRSGRCIRINVPADQGPVIEYGEAAVGDLGTSGADG